MGQHPNTAIEIRPVDGPIDISIQPPGSKSITNRALLCAALANGKSTLHGVLDSDDTRVMARCLNELGVDIDHDSTSNISHVSGCGGRFPNSSATLFVENSGTTIRFLTAALAVHGGQFRLEGIERMHQRPIGSLVDALNQLGCNVRTESNGSNGRCPPVVIDNNRVSGGITSISGTLSSQYLSGLMMATPLAKETMQIELTGNLVSKPYAEMTIQVMNSFGVELTGNGSGEDFRYSCSNEQSYVATDYSIEPDASAASYFLAAAAICGGRATVVGLNQESIQGDIEFVRCLESMGCEIRFGPNEVSIVGRARRGIDVDMSDISDTVQTIAAVALFVTGATRIRGVAHNRLKETDRIADLATELRKLGANVGEHEDGLTIEPGQLQATTIETYNDHRMAMSLALVGLRQKGVTINNPGCTSKTYPRFFEDLETLYRKN